jgi:DNA (cytosine-5)-methyltransferase 1
VKPLLLDMFCCQGGAAEGYARAGFEVVGVDINPQPRYPFRFHRFDALQVLDSVVRGGGSFMGQKLDAIHASPPCQRYSNTQRIRDREHPDLIAPTRARLAASGLPYVIENVMGAANDLREPIMLCGAMFPALRVYRHRLFECSFPITAPAHPAHVAPQVKMGRAPGPGEWVQAVGNFSGVSEARGAMEMPWASREGLREAVPPAYAEYVGGYLMAEVERRNLTIAAHELKEAA